MSVAPKRSEVDYCDCPYCQGCKIKRDPLPARAKSRKRSEPEVAPVLKEEEPKEPEFQAWQEPLEEEPSSPTVSSSSYADE